MALGGSLGSLVLSLSAETARFQSDLGRAHRVAEKFSRDVGRALGSVQSALLTMAGATGMAAAIKATAAMQAGLDDLAETIGGNVTALDGLRRVAFVSGTELTKVAGAAVLLAKNLRSSEDAAEAVRVLGLNLQTLKAATPEQAFQQIALALAKFQDGGGKAAAAVALLGRSGAELLPFLKDLAEAGELHGRVTAQQAADSERLEKEMRRMSLAAQDVRDAFSNALIPKLGDYLEQLREGIRITGSFSSALMQLGTMSPFGSAGSNIQDLNAQLEELSTNRGLLDGLKGYEGAISAIDRETTIIQNRIKFLKFLQQQEAMKLTGPGFQDARDLRLQQKPTLTFIDPAEAARQAAEAARLARESAKAAEEQFRKLSESIKTAHDDALAWAEAGKVIEQADIEGRIKMEDQVFDFEAQNEAKFEALRLAMQTEEEMEYEAHIAKMERLNEFTNEQLEALGGRQAMEAALTAQHNAKLLAMEMGKHQAVRGMEIMTFQLAVGLLKRFAGESKAAAIAIIAIEKGLAVAEIVIAAEVAKMKAFAVYGPTPAGAAAAASIELMRALSIGIVGATALLDIADVSKGGGGAQSVSLPPAQGVRVSPSGSLGGTAEPSGPRQTTVIHLHGDSFDGKALRNLVKAINEARRDGDLVIA